MLRILLCGVTGLMISHAVYSQVAVSAGGQDIRIGTDGSISVKGGEQDVRTGPAGQVSAGRGNSVHSSVGEVAPDTNIEGVTIINGKLWIDGKEVPAGVKRYKSHKNGKVYSIEREGKNISVTSND